MFTIAELTELLGWSIIINTGILVFSTFMLISMKRYIVTIHSKLFGLDETYLLRAYFDYLGKYKIVIITLNLVPYIALKIMG